jgi:serine phosphatase RsbU (regulator of sigma subunit)
MTSTDGPSHEDAENTVLRPPNGIRKHAADVAHYIEVVEGSELGKRVEVGPTPVTVGRHADNLFSLSDPFVSAHHCVITLENGQLWVTDLGSSNGTFIGEQRIPQRSPWPAEAALYVGKQMLRQAYHRREELQRADALTKDLRHAAHYVKTLLPQPLQGGIITTAWHFEPCTELGGDIFDYFWLDRDHFVFYLLDVSGHGVGAALHSISVFNLLRRQSLPGVNFAQPKQVLKALNDALPMEHYADMFFTVWYGVFQPSAARLTFSAAGHPPALLFYDEGKRRLELRAENVPIGITADVEFRERTIPLYPGCRIGLYSDGVYEITHQNGALWRWEEFVQFMQESLRNGADQPEFICRKIRGLTNADRFEDDCSLVLLDF